MRKPLIPRRRFLKTSLAVSASAAIVPTSWSALSRNRVDGANERIRMGAIGFNSRGRGLIEDFRSVEEVEISALCDVDSTVLARQVKDCESKGETVQAHKDFRRILDDKNIDAVLTATPNHWHALLTVWSCQAGKDVYVEKPASHNLWEGRQMIKAARKYGRMVQTGTQCRSNPGMQEAMAFLHQRGLGKLKWARGLCYKPRPSIGKVNEPLPPPQSVDFDLWMGPAPLQPIRRKQFHYDWHWQWAYGNGDIGNQGPHQMDLARWAIGADSLSQGVVSVGGRVGYDDDGEWPNTLITIHDYRPAPIIFEVRGLPEKTDSKSMDSYRGSRVGLVVECENGSMVFSNYSGGIAYDRDGKEVKRFLENGHHAANFINAMKSRNHKDLTADIEEGHLSAGLCHMSNISHRLGKPTPKGDIANAIKESPQLTDSFERLQSHMEANEVDLEKQPLYLGRALAFDPAEELFINDDEANSMRTRIYRESFALPKEV